GGGWSQPPAATVCLGKNYVNFAAGGGGKLVSFKRDSFPHVAPYTAAFEGLVSFESQGRDVPLPLCVGALARSRTELVLITSRRARTTWPPGWGEGKLISYCPEWAEREFDRAGNGRRPASRRFTTCATGAERSGTT